MAGTVVTLANEDALLQDDYARPARRSTKKKKTKRSSTSHTERPMAKHPGFKAVQKSIAAKEGVPMKNAGAILASASHKASPAANKKNPNLKKVKGSSSKKSPPKKSGGYGSSPIAKAMGC